MRSFSENRGDYIYKDSHGDVYRLRVTNERDNPFEIKLEARFDHEERNSSVAKTNKPIDRDLPADSVVSRTRVGSRSDAHRADGQDSNAADPQPEPQREAQLKGRPDANETKYESFDR